MRNRNFFNEDQLAIFENRVRSVGVWCDTSVSSRFRHKFVCRNPKATIAISLCGDKIIPLDKLHENTISQKCLVCALYDESETEVKEKLNIVLEHITRKVIETQNQTKE
jgi:hypothetical protein